MNHLIQRCLITSSQIVRFIIYFFITGCFLFICESVVAQNTLDLAGLNSSAPASTAFSMRLLSSTYAGSALQIRRSSDNATQDIYFTIDGNLDTSAIKTFVGAGDGYVAIWYDQSGNANNLIQSTINQQPILVTAGVINRENNQPFIRFFVNSGIPNSLNLTNGEMTTVGHVSAVHRFEAGGDGFILSHAVSYYWHSDPNLYLFSTTYTSMSIMNGSAWTNGNATATNLMQFSTILTLNENEPLNPNSETSWDNLGADRVFHYTTGGGGYSELLIFPAALSVTNRQNAEISEVNYFNIGGALPLTWISFTAEIKAPHIQLKWETADEQQTKDFTIQHSTNGNRWTDLETVPSLHTNLGSNHYGFLHQNPADGNHFYRILQTDLDGKSSYSAIKTIRLVKTVPAFTILGNPSANSLLFVQIKEALVLSLFNSEGKLIWKKQVAAGTHQFSVSDLQTGIYFLKANTTTEQLLIQ